ncbi:MAG TPA: 4Fe-4S single cluster domain-containing protein [Saprospiraceae bacterium]|nr:4Fe-4S single cluster domain-containing protein [Saprospiraceae bacterium]
MSGDTHFNSTNKVNVASFTTHTSALGPGIRAVVWVQGCPLHCRGCLAPGWIPFIQANLMTPTEILEKFEIQKIDGLTFSGGEPFEQASGLAELARLARKKKDLNIICFTGYRYELLQNHPPNDGVYELLKEIDVLIDGPYIESLNDSIGLRGSSNQRIIHLTSRLRLYDLEDQKRKLEVTIRDGEMAFVGIPTPGIKSVMDLAYKSEFERMDEDERL